MSNKILPMAGQWGSLSGDTITFNEPGVIADTVPFSALNTRGLLDVHDTICGLLRDTEGNYVVGLFRYLPNKKMKLIATDLVEGTITNGASVMLTGAHTRRELRYLRQRNRFEIGSGVFELRPEHNNGILYCRGAGVDIIIPASLLADGFRCVVIKEGSGLVHVHPQVVTGPPVSYGTLNGVSHVFSITGEYAEVPLYFIEESAWVLANPSAIEDVGIATPQFFPTDAYYGTVPYNPNLELGPTAQLSAFTTQYASNRGVIKFPMVHTDGNIYALIERDSGASGISAAKINCSTHATSVVTIPTFYLRSILAGCRGLDGSLYWLTTSAYGSDQWGLTTIHLKNNTNDFETTSFFTYSGDISTINEEYAAVVARKKLYLLCHQSLYRSFVFDLTTGVGQAITFGLPEEGCPGLNYYNYRLPPVALSTGEILCPVNFGYPEWDFRKYSTFLLLLQPHSNSSALLDTTTLADHTWILDGFGGEGGAAPPAILHMYDKASGELVLLHKRMFSDEASYPENVYKPGMAAVRVDDLLQLEIPALGGFAEAGPIIVDYYRDGELFSTYQDQTMLFDSLRPSFLAPNGAQYFFSSYYRYSVSEELWYKVDCLLAMTPLGVYIVKGVEVGTVTTQNPKIPSEATPVRGTDNAMYFLADNSWSPVLRSPMVDTVSKQYVPVSSPAYLEYSRLGQVPALATAIENIEGSETGGPIRGLVSGGTPPPGGWPGFNNGIDVVTFKTGDREYSYVLAMGRVQLILWRDVITEA